MKTAAKLQADCFCARYGDMLPFDEVVVPEATDYLVHFCGLACFDVWRGLAIEFVEGPTVHINPGVDADHGL
jgi:hypothetical protein